MAVTHPDPEPTASSAWADPPLECDVVMKGGITSGVVYPGAVVRLAKRYRFRSIGGTSAGALAAAASAAAEHGRGRGGFEKLAQVPGQLGGSANGDPFILTLFPPEASTKPLFNAAISFQRGGIAGGIRATLKAFPRFPLIAAALVAVALVLGLTEAVPWAVAVAVISIAPWLLVVGLGRDLFTAFTRLAKNDFGLCRLGPASGQPNALTLWLHNLVQDLAGRNPGEAVLTFADLWGLEPLHGNETPDHLAARDKRRALLASTPAERAIDLQMITTNLTVGRPLRLPMQRDRWRESYDDGGLLFDPNEWAQYVPQDVLDHMTKVAEHPKDDAAAVLAAQAAGRTLLYFPGSAGPARRRRGPDEPQLPGPRSRPCRSGKSNTATTETTSFAGWSSPTAASPPTSPSTCSTAPSPPGQHSRSTSQASNPTTKPTSTTPPTASATPPHQPVAPPRPGTIPAPCSGSSSRSKTQSRTGATTPRPACPASANASSTSNSAAAKAASTSPWTNGRSNG